jgi:hypothetical protein
VKLVAFDLYGDVDLDKREVLHRTAGGDDLLAFSWDFEPCLRVEGVVVEHSLNPDGSLRIVMLTPDDHAERMAVQPDVGDVTWSP